MAKVVATCREAGLPELCWYCLQHNQEDLPEGVRTVVHSWVPFSGSALNYREFGVRKGHPSLKVRTLRRVFACDEELAYRGLRSGVRISAKSSGMISGGSDWMNSAPLLPGDDLLPPPGICANLCNGLAVPCPRTRLTEEKRGRVSVGHADAAPSICAFPGSSLPAFASEILYKICFVSSQLRENPRSSSLIQARLSSPPSANLRLSELMLELRLC